MKSEEEVRALKIFGKASKIREKVKGFGHRGTLIINTVIAGLLIQLERLNEALELLERVADYG